MQSNLDFFFYLERQKLIYDTLTVQLDH